MVDGLAVGLGYGIVLLTIAVFREALGFGTLLGYRVMPAGFTPWTIMVMAPGAFFMLGLFIWFVKSRFPQVEKETKR